MKFLASAVVALCLSSAIVGQRSDFNVRYLGGTVETKTNKNDWHNKLTVLSDEIRLELKDGQKISIDPKSVKSISYGRAATRHVARWVALGILVSPIALIGIFNENVQHYISIEYKLPDEKDGGVFLQAHKDNYRSLISHLRGATGKDVETETKRKNPKNPPASNKD